MKTFLKMLLASIVGGLILMFLLFIGFATFISIIGASNQEVIIDNGSVLKLDMNTVIYDRADNNPFSSFDPFSGEAEKALGLDEILASLKSAKTDDRILGIFLDGGIPLTGHATLREIRNALLEFKESGKFIYSYTDIMTQKGYYLASVADSVFVNPEGFIEWKGLSASVSYYKDAMDKLGLKPEVLRATGNKFKSAVEPFLRQDMSDENRDQLNVLLTSIWSDYKSDISATLNIPAAKLDTLANILAFSGPKKAQKNGLITAVAYRDEIMDVIMKKTDKKKIKNIPFISIHRYAESANLSGEGGYGKDKIAVIIAQGEIVNGQGGEYSLGGDRISAAIRKARTDDKVKAVVLRVNSPGGSAMASEIIWREVDLTRQVKPVIASMGDLAASGGYYISCYADTIVAQPNTITGSIGAFGLFFTGQELLNNKLGINIETVSTNKYSDLGTFDRPLSESEKRLLISSVDDIYNTFKERVATGRELTVEYVDSIGQGRVWSGSDAMKLGLVDVMGGLETAIDIAKDKSGIEDEYRIVVYPEPEDPFEKIIRQITGDYETRIIEDRLGEYARYLDLLKKIENTQGYQTRMEFDLVID